MYKVNEEKIKIFVIVWCSYHDGTVDNGAILCHTKEESQSKLKELYQQSKENIEYPYTCDELDKNAYFVESDHGDHWERAEILIKHF